MRSKWRCGLVIVEMEFECNNGWHSVLMDHHQLGKALPEALQRDKVPSGCNTIMSHMKVSIGLMPINRHKLIDEPLIKG